MTRSAPWLVAVLCLAVGGSLWYQRARPVSGSPQRAVEIVRRAWTDGRNVAMEGKQRVKSSEKQIDVEANVNLAANGDVRIEYLSGRLKGVTIWENGEQTYRFRPTEKRLTVARRRDSRFSKSRDELQFLDNYVVQLKGEGEIAERPAFTVELHSKNNPNRWRRLWIDRETYFLLATEEHQDQLPGSKPIRSSQFTKIRYLAKGETPDPAKFVPPADLVRKYGTARPGDSSSSFSPEELSTLVGFTVRQPAYLPKGYKLAGAYQTPCTCSVRHQAARLEYSDGLTTLTLFECGHPQCPEGSKCFGGDPRDTMTAFRRQGRYYYLLVGDLPHREMERILDGLGGP